MSDNNFDDAAGVSTNSVSTAIAGEAVDFGNPGYQVVCYSNVRLGDCGTYFNVINSVDGTMTDGSKAVWLLIEANSQVKKESLAELQAKNQDGWAYPGYKYCCYSSVRLGDCGTFFNVLDSIAGTMTDGTKALWLLIQ